MGFCQSLSRIWSWPLTLLPTPYTALSVFLSAAWCMVWHHPMISRIQLTLSWDPEQCRLHAAGEPHSPLLQILRRCKMTQQKPHPYPSMPGRTPALLGVCWKLDPACHRAPASFPIGEHQSDNAHTQGRRQRKSIEKVYFY